MRPAFKFSRVRAAIDARRDTAQTERATESAAQFLLRRKGLPEQGQTGRGRQAPGTEKPRDPVAHEDLTHGVRNMRQKLQQQRELWSKPKQLRRGEQQERHFGSGHYNIGIAAEAHDLPAGAVRGVLQKIRRQREQWSPSRPVETARAGTAKPSPPPLGAFQGRPAQRRATVIDPRASKAGARPQTTIRSRIWVIALLVAGAAAVGILESERLVSAAGKAHLLTNSLLSRIGIGIRGAESPQQVDLASPSAAVQPAATSARSAVSHPVPDSYGLFVLSDGKLKRLETTRVRVPDTRIALGGLITKPSAVTLPGGKLSFIAYQRDLITNAPDNASVRIVAKVQRALKFTAAGKPVTTPVEDIWAVRAVSIDLTVAPLPESQEMVLLRPADPELSLSPGRYMLVYKNQSYDFAVEGKITDTAQCLERTDSQDGAVYSECRELP